MGYLVLVRHGESRWNLDNKFTGWVDVPLTNKGIQEALLSAKKLKNINFDVAYTSKLTRAHETLLLILASQKRTGIFLHTSPKRKKRSQHPGPWEKHEIPIFSDDALNERYYGALQGSNKASMRRKFGKEKVHSWRRSWDIRPPKGEALKDTYNRCIPYFKKAVMKDVHKGKNVIVSAHGNSLRAIIKYLDGISNEDIPHLELPYGLPIIYKYSRGKLVKSRKHSFTRKVRW